MRSNRQSAGGWHRLAWSMGCVAFLSHVGCAERPPLELAAPAGHLIMLPGVEGRTWQLDGMVAGLRDAKVNLSLHPIPWTDLPFQRLENLTNLEANQRRAGNIVQLIQQLQERNPDQPVSLLGFSGGGGLALLVMEAMPDEMQIERLVLIAAAYSADYDLTEVIRKCRSGVVNFYSPHDRLTLGLGTGLFGNIDRRKEPSAGRVGFVSAGGKPRKMPGLTQVSWQPRWMWLGHHGGHIGWLSRAWARDVLAPFVVPENHDSEAEPSASGE